eukprot:gene4191-7810_t
MRQPAGTAAQPKPAIGARLRRVVQITRLNGGGRQAPQSVCAPAGRGALQP